MKPLKEAISGLEAVALACETVTKSVTLAGTDMRDHAADIRAVLAELAKNSPYEIALREVEFFENGRVAR